MRARVRTDFPSPNERGVLEVLAQKKGCKGVYLREFKRFGFSGSKLFLIHFSPDAKTLPYLLKLGSLEAMNQEMAGIEALRPFLSDAAEIPTDEVYTNNSKVGGILYHYRHDSSPQGNLFIPDTFGEVAFINESGNRKPESIISEVFKRLELAHQSGTRSNAPGSRSGFLRVKVEEHYGKYFRMDDSREILKRVFDGRPASESTLLGARVADPISLRKDLSSHSRDVKCGTIHGDLHTNNIIVGKHWDPSLIDFAWSASSLDILIDFVFLELSLRFKDSPTLVHPDDQLWVDQLLLKVDGEKEVSTSQRLLNRTGESFKRLGCLVGEIRRLAREAVGSKFRFDDYLLTQFIVLYGLFKYRMYENIFAARALGMIANAVR